MATLQFPLEDYEDYNGWITFRFYEINIDATVTGPFVDAFESVTSFISGNDNGETVTTGTQSSLTVKRDERRLKNSIRLYLPPALTFQDGITYDNNVDLGAIGGAAQGALTSGRGGTVTGEQIKNAIGNAFGAVGDILTNSTTADTARVAAMSTARFTSGRESTISNVVQSSLRVAPNPNRRTLFRSVRPREFSFQFKLIANSPEEAESIDQIIREFRTRMYPEAVSLNDEENLFSGDFIAYNYPDMVEIEMTYNGRQVGPRIQRGYVAQLQTVFNPSNMGYHVDGKPSEVDITLMFMEERTLDRNDVKYGGY